MASPASPPVAITNYPYNSVKVAPEPDLTIRVYEYQNVKTARGQRPPVKCVTDYAVSKAIICANSAPFNAMLKGGWRESTADLVELKENDLIINLAMEIWFRAFHGVPMTDECLDADVRVVWSIMRAGDMWFLKRADLIKWFGDWYKRWWNKNAKGKNLNDSTSFRCQNLAQVVLFPCWAFDHAPGFAAATKWLVYNSVSHITEFNPTQFREYHLPKRVIRKYTNPVEANRLC